MVGYVKVVAAPSLESLAVIPTFKYRIKEQDRIDEQGGQIFFDYYIKNVHS
jgi:hypothetical protein